MVETKKYHNLWYLELNDKSVLFLLYWLKATSVEQITGGLPRIQRHEWSANHFAIEWESFVGNEHTHQYTEEPSRKLLAIREILQPITTLLFPQWIMDRFKEALDQHVRGEWMSSISLCGDIVEFIVYEFWTAYNEDIPTEFKKTPSDGTERNLRRLNEFGIIDNDDHEKLLTVRRIRDTHVHYRPRDRLLPNYEERLKADNIDVLRKLAEVFTLQNMESKYRKYLEYAMREQAPAPIDPTVYGKRV